MESRKAEKPVIQPIQLSLLGRRKVGGGAWTADRKQRAQQVFADRGLVGPRPRLLGPGYSGAVRGSKPPSRRVQESTGD